jgi:hypothetical protein
MRLSMQTGSIYMDDIFSTGQIVTKTSHYNVSFGGSPHEIVRFYLSHDTILILLYC